MMYLKSLIFNRRGFYKLPPPTKGDLFFDIEGFPFVEGGLEYLLVYMN